MYPIRRALAVALLSFVPAVAPTNAAIRTVDVVADENNSGCVPGGCSLREALADAGEGDEIVFELPGSPPWTIRLQSGVGFGPLVVDVGVSITGPGMDQLTISGDSDADGTGDLRVFNVTTSGAPEVSDLTLRDGRLTSSADRHGGCVLSNGDTFFRRVRFENCRAWSAGTLDLGIPGGNGGAIFVAAGSALRVEDTIFVGNLGGAGGGTTMGTDQYAGGSGGGIASSGDFTAVLRSVFLDNQGGKGGSTAGPGGGGGAIAVLAGVTLIEDSTFESNESGDGGNFGATQGPDGAGGAVWTSAEVTFNNVTLSGNSVGTTSIGTAATGGAIRVAGGTARLRNVTVTANTSNGAGGGIARSAGTLQMANSIIAGNSSTGTSSEDCTGAVSSLGFNVVGVNNGCAASLVATDQSGTAASPLDASLQPLGDNGGPTDTHALVEGSPAIDGGDPADCLGWNPNPGVDFPFVTDQRGETRPTDGDGDSSVVCDAGAFEAPTVVASTWVLTVSLGGSGSGSVVSSPVGISCPGDCDEAYVEGTDVDLMPSEDPGSVFAGWSGDCTGSGSCVVEMTADRDVTATFVPLRTLTVTVVGGGAVTSTPAGIDCPADCTEDYPEAETVSLSADPAPGFELAAWSGDCAGTGACEVTMSQNRAVTATFQPVVVPRTLTVTVSGPGAVISSPPGIFCPGDCAQDFSDGTVVTLSADPEPDAFLVSWSGDCSGSAGCEVTMSVDRSVGAAFDTLPFLDGFESGDTGAWSLVIP